MIHMNRKPFVIIVAALMLVPLAGCASAKKKFMRKGEERVIRPVVFTEEGYSKEFSNKYYYGTHFTNWKTWQDELINYWGKNAKRERRSADEIISNLESMRDLLREPKKSELDAQIDVAKQIRSTIVEDRRSGALRSEAEKLKRVINSNFYYDKVKEFVIPDDIALTPPAGSTTAPVASNTAAPSAP